MSSVKSILLQIKHQNEIYDLYTRTSAQNVIVDAKTGETLKERLASIASLMGTEGVSQQIDQKVSEAINDLVNGEGNPEVLDTIKDLVGWIDDNKDKFDDLTSVTSQLKIELQNKIAEVEGKVDQNASDISTNAQNIATNSANIATNAQNIAANAQNIAINTQAISQNIEDIEKNAEDIQALEEKVDELVPEGALEGQVLTRRGDANVWEKPFELVEELPTVMNEGQLFAVMLDDDPVATTVKADGTIVQYATIEEALTKAEEGETIRLTENVVLNEAINVADGVVIDLNGHTLKEA